MSLRIRRVFAGILIIALFIALVVSLSGCGASPSPSPDVVTSSSEAPAQTNTADTLAGVWVSEGDVPFEATITADTITVKIVDGETKSLFWQGTFPTSAQKGDILLSDADVEALSSSMMGSSELVKPFSYEGDEITFEFSMMGTSTVIHVKK
jgi:hypothetical protein